MKYYQISRSAEPKIIGIKDGTSQVKLIVNDILDNQDYIEFDNHFSDYNKDFFLNQQKAGLLKPPFFKGVLRKNAKVTDLMRYGQMFYNLYYMYSEKYIEIIKTHDIGKHYLFPVKVESVNSMYYLMYLNMIPTAELIFDKCVFYTGRADLGNLKYHPLVSYAEYLKLLEIEPLLAREKIAISRDHYGKDIIAIQGSSYYFYSQRLTEFLLECGMTGLQVGYNKSIQLEFV